MKFKFQNPYTKLPWNSAMLVDTSSVCDRLGVEIPDLMKYLMQRSRMSG